MQQELFQAKSPLKKIFSCLWKTLLDKIFGFDILKIMNNINNIQTNYFLKKRYSCILFCVVHYKTRFSERCFVLEKYRTKVLSV